MGLYGLRKVRATWEGLGQLLKRHLRRVALFLACLASFGSTSKSMLAVKMSSWAPVWAPVWLEELKIEGWKAGPL